MACCVSAKADEGRRGKRDEAWEMGKYDAKIDASARPHSVALSPPTTFKFAVVCGSLISSVAWLVRCRLDESNEYTRFSSYTVFEFAISICMGRKYQRIDQIRLCAKEPGGAWSLK